ncbi:MAG: hypothetical protein ABS45_14450 [Comamonas sp. SCN 65-56]|uniref:hypothetical protein n=1 Tax=Comamonas sp. SCN 65-56 TaxID=1660095 RepID=UPI00086E0F77|nr:hypothetical protein [Comamonas sp. SCN 65-56]ODS91072.1 MAG: hypothetical protein ABS45_14450 [Comamonas sp. SCN 65-56]
MNRSLPRRRRFLAGLVLPVAAWALAGCATQPGSGADQAALLERATAYWAAVKANDRVKAWSYEAASKTGTSTLEGYLKRGGMVFDAVQVRGVQEISGDTAKVAVHQRYSIPMMRIKNMDTDIQDPWQRIDGVWFHAPVVNPLFQKQADPSKSS